MAVVTRDLGSVVGPTGPVGPAGTYTLTSNDKNDIAEIVGDDKYLPKTALKIDVYNNTSSTYPTIIDYVAGTVTVKDSDNTTIATFQTNAQQVVMYCPAYSKYTVSVTANGFTTPATQTIVVPPNGTTISFSMTPTAEVYYDVIYKVEGTIVQATRVLPHASAPYTGTVPAAEGKVWSGWDGTATDVIANTTINATFVTAVLPASPAVLSDYDYAWTDDTNYTSAYTSAEFAGIMMLAANVSTYLPKGAKIRFGLSPSVGTTNHIVAELVGYKHYKLSDDSGWSKTVWDSIALFNETHTYHNAFNVPTWGVTTFRTWLNDTVFISFNQFVKSLVKQVKTRCRNNGSVTISESDDYLFALSTAELGISTSTTPYKEEIETGADEIAFSKFVDNASRKKYYNDGAGSSDRWYIRGLGDLIGSDGTKTGGNPQSASGVSPAFVI